VVLEVLVIGTAWLVYAFLPNKKQDTYRELFQALVDRCQANQLQMAVQTVVTDFEDSVLPAVTAVFGRPLS
jgi:malate synthase